MSPLISFFYSNEQDAWLDNVDWKKIRQKENEEKDKDKEDNEEDEDEDEDNDLEDYTPSVISWKEKAPLYEEIISLMQPGKSHYVLTTQDIMAS